MLGNLTNVVTIPNNVLQGQFKDAGVNSLRLAINTTLGIGGIFDVASYYGLKKRDKEINAFQQDVRRKVLTHYAVEQDTSDMANGLILINMVVDIERIGDYCKNILDLAINYPEKIISKDISSDLLLIESEVKTRFDQTIDAIQTQDTNIARRQMEGYREQLTGKSDNIVNNALKGEVEYGSQAKTAAVVLYSRYLKRIGAHLKNITTTVINPFDSIGYKK